MGKIFSFLFVILITQVFLFGCAANQGPYTSRSHRKYYEKSTHPSVQRADEIQYRSAYKYDIKGKKYIKHYQEQEKRNKKK